jgi:hypothetical protein
METIIKELISKYEDERKLMDELLSLSNITDIESEKYLSVRRFISSFINDLKKMEKILNE